MERIVIITTDHTNKELEPKVIKSGRMEEFEEFLQSCTLVMEAYKDEDGKFHVMNDDYLNVIIGVFYESELEYMKSILYDFEVKFTIEDITNEVIFDQFNTNERLAEWIHPITRTYFDQFINEHLTQDIVLDKISIYGKDSLTIKDKSLLSGEIIEEIFSDI